MNQKPLSILQPLILLYLSVGYSWVGDGCSDGWPMVEMWLMKASGDVGDRQDDSTTKEEKIPGNRFHARS